MEEIRRSNTSFFSCLSLDVVDTSNKGHARALARAGNPYQRRLTHFVGGFLTFIGTPGHPPEVEN